MTEKKTTAKKTVKKTAKKAEQAEPKLTMDMLWNENMAAPTFSYEPYGIKGMELKTRLTIAERTAILRAVEEDVFIEDEYLPELEEMLLRGNVFSAYTGIGIGKDVDRVYNLVMDEDFWSAFEGAILDGHETMREMEEALYWRIHYKRQMKAAQQEARLNEMFAVLQNANDQVQKMAQDLAGMDVSAIAGAVERLQKTITDKTGADAK